VGPQWDGLDLGGGGVWVRVEEAGGDGTPVREQRPTAHTCRTQTHAVHEKGCSQGAKAAHNNTLVHAVPPTGSPLWAVLWAICAVGPVALLGACSCLSWHALGPGAGHCVCCRGWNIEAASLSARLKILSASNASVKAVPEPQAPGVDTVILGVTPNERKGACDARVCGGDREGRVSGQGQGQRPGLQCARSPLPPPPPIPPVADVGNTHGMCWQSNGGLESRFRRRFSALSKV
jgi:hypothetical protein